MLYKTVESFNKLKAYCDKSDFKGWDPFDGLNSRIFRAIPYLSRNKYSRLLWIQFFKRCPLNLRKLFLINKGYNPKGLGLFLSGYCNLYRTDPQPDYLDKIHFLAAKLKSLKTKGWSGDCWGYNFDWQARAFYHPGKTPTVVASVFIAYALLDSYEITRDESLLVSARSVCDFILNDLNRTYDDAGNYIFSYSPLDTSQIFNASLLAAKLLARVYSFTKEEKLVMEAKKAVSFCCNYQGDNGSWSYGTLTYHQWVDNFHTGFNLECLAEYQKHSGDYSFQVNIQKGLDYYLNNFFTIKGEAKYYNNKKYPIDIHAPAQLISTLAHLDQFENNAALIDNVMDWVIQNMQNKTGYFYYQCNKNFSSKIPYIRWAQGWMFYALSLYLNKNGIKLDPSQNKVNLFKIPLDAITMQQTLALIFNTIKKKKQIHHVAVNAGKVVKMQDDKQLFDSVVNADIISADGQAVVWAAQLLGKPIPERVTGIDLMDNIVEMAHQKKYKIFLFGAAEEVLRKVIKIYSKKYSPDLIAGYRNGFFKKDEEMQIAQQISKSKAHILLVAITSPIKENFLYKYKKILKNVSFIMGVGGSFDIVAGKVRRAPRWMQKTGLEWFYRLIQEPRRLWKRYFIDNLRFIYLVLKEKFAG